MFYVSDCHFDILEWLSGTRECQLCPISPCTLAPPLTLPPGSASFSEVDNTIISALEGALCWLCGMHVSELRQNIVGLCMCVGV